MPKQRWTDFTDAHPDGHLVVALVLRRGQALRDKAAVEGLRVLLESLIDKLVPAGPCATVIVPRDGVQAIYCVFATRTAAHRLAEAVRA